MDAPFPRRQDAPRGSARGVLTAAEQWSTRGGRLVRSRRCKIAPLMSPCRLWRGAGDVRRGALCSGTACGCRGGSEPSRGRSAVRDRPPHGEGDAELLGAAGVSAVKAGRRPKLEGFTGIIDATLEADRGPDVPRKQRHTAHRIFERLRDEHRFTGGYTIVKDYVLSQRQSTARRSFRCTIRCAMPRSTSARRSSRSGPAREGRLRSRVSLRRRPPDAFAGHRGDFALGSGHAVSVHQG